MDWSKTLIDDLVNQEAANFDLSKKLLVEDLPFLERFRKFFHNPPLTIPDQKYLQLRLFYDSAKFLDYAVITLMRGHITEAMFEFRRSVESVAFAYKMKDLEKAKIWLTKEYTDKDFKKAMRDFKWQGMGSLVQLKSYWKTTSSLGGHSGIKSQLYRHQKVQGNKSSHGYFDFNNTNPSYLIKSYFHYLITGNMFVLETYQKIFEDVLPKDWGDDLFKAMGEYNRYKHSKLKAWMEKNSPYTRKPAGIIIPKPGDVLRLVLKI